MPSSASAESTGEGERLLRAGQWQGWSPTSLLGTQVTGATLGIIGMGRIGAALARRAHLGFGMEVVYHNRQPVEKAEYQWATLEELLSRADFVSLNCPSNAQTHHLIGEQNLKRMKSSAFLINTARGDVVDEDALVDALATTTIAGCGLDVYEGEPNVHPGLLDFEEAVLLPHQGSGTVATRVAMGNMEVENIKAFLANQPVPNAV